MKNALNNQVGMLGDIFLWLVANLKQGVIYFIKQALPPNKSAGSVGSFFFFKINEFTPLSTVIYESRTEFSNESTCCWGLMAGHKRI